VESDPTAAISPHAPYSTPWTLIRSCVELARAQDRPLAMHVAESPDERELLLHGSGPFADSLRSIGVWQEGLFPWGPQPVTELIRMLGRAPRGLIVHGNDLQVDEMDALAGYPNLTVVYCPRTHDFFRYPPHPVGQLLAVGVRVALGTDSRASNPDLSVWGEVQFLLKHRSDLDPHAILTMATVNGAQALGRPELGGLCEGNVAKFGVVASRAPSVDCLYGDLAENEYEPIQC
jgi:cytosine/adenosine deaminase-related metal-dependent hydrolase